MGRRNIRLIPVDNRQHMIPEELAEAIDADLRAGLITEPPLGIGDIYVGR